jgi:ribokinase
MGNVFVLGSINMDLVARSDRHPVPGETVMGSSLSYFPGGKGANQAVAAARAGAAVRMIGAVGADGFGDTLTEFLRQEGIDASRVQVSGSSPTGTALIVLNAAGENTIVVVPGANGEVRSQPDLWQEFSPSDILVSQFEVPEKAIADFFLAGKKAGARTVLNTAPARECGADFLNLADVILLNETELTFFLKKRIESSVDEDAIAAAARSLITRPDQVVIVTLGARGALIVDPSRVSAAPSHSVAVVDTTGAGDCFTGNIAAALARGERLTEAATFAAAAAALCIGRQGAGPSMPYVDETKKFLLQTQLSQKADDYVPSIARA